MAIFMRLRFHTLIAPSATAINRPTCQETAVRMPRKIIGAKIAPTAKEACSRLVAAGLPPESRFAMRLLKFVTLPRPRPTSKKASNSQMGLPHSAIIKIPI